MRLILTKGEWWWVQCLCGGDSCEDNPTQKPFRFTPTTALSSMGFSVGVR